MHVEAEGAAARMRKAQQRRTDVDAVADGSRIRLEVGSSWLPAEQPMSSTLRGLNSGRVIFRYSAIERATPPREWRSCRPAV